MDVNASQTDLHLVKGGNLGYLSFNLVVVIGTICNNLLFIIAILRTKKLHTYSNCIRFNLAVADITWGIVGFVTCIVVFYYKTLCIPINTVFYVFGEFFTFASVCLLIATATDMMLAIHWPLKYTFWMTKRLCFGMCFGCWISAGVLTAVPYIILRIPASACVIHTSDDFWFVNDIVLKLVFLPTLFLIYVPVFRALITQVKKNKAVHSKCDGRNCPTKQSGSKHNVIANCLALCLFQIMWLPKMTILILDYCDMINAFVDGPAYYALNFSCVFTKINSFANPIIYGLRIRQIRKAYTHYLCLIVKRPHPSATGSTD